MPKIAISYDDKAVRQRLAELRDRGGNLGPAMREIAGHLLDGVNEAFAREASPAGAPWAPLKPATVEDRLRQRYGSGPILERVRRPRRTHSRGLGQHGRRRRHERRLCRHAPLRGR